jgi:NSS family neurotransmitter:Na+ symporter
MEQKEVFTSRWGLLLAALGMAVGCGNVWRFPRMAFSYGGAAFLIPWIIFLFLWSIPLLIIEFAMGRESRKGTIGSFGVFMGKEYCWMGAFVGFCCMGIMFYYSVVMGWCIKYFLRGIFGGPLGEYSSRYWELFNSSYQPIIFHFISISIGAYIIYRGVVKGIEKANRFLIPALFLLLIIAAARSLTLPGAVKGLNFLFTPQWGRLLDYQVWLQALTQSAWSTGAGWGLILTYAVYMKKREDVVLNSFIVGLGDYTASLIAALAIIPTAFALLSQADAQAAMQSDNLGLTYIWIPRLFNHMPAGSLFMSLFFLALTFAALSSLISMIELSTRIFMDAGLIRRKAILFVGIGAFLLGLPSAISLGFFNNQDWVWGIGLLISGMFFALAAIKFGISKFRNTLINVEGNDIKLGKWWEIIVCFIIFIEFGGMLVWWFYQAVVSNPETWWNPFKTSSLGTCLFQWGIAIILFIIFNNWLAKKTLSKQKIEEN